jgi:hypothetical protein
MIITIDLLSPKNQTAIAPQNPKSRSPLPQPSNSDHPPTPQHHDRHFIKNQTAIALSTPKTSQSPQSKKLNSDRTLAKSTFIN